MGVASLVLGIVSAIIGLIPFCGLIAIIPAFIGIILGIVDLVKKNKDKEAKKGMPIAGIILSTIAIVIIVVYNVFIVGSAAYGLLRNVDLNNVDLNNTDLNNIDLNNIDINDIDLNDININDIRSLYEE